MSIRAKWFSKNVDKKLKAQIKESTTAMAQQALEKADQLLSTPWPPPASRGTPPHERTGKLRRSLRIDVSDVAFFQQTVRVYADEEYAVPLEFGFVNHLTGRFTGPYPFLRPAMDSIKGTWKRHWRRAL